MVQDSELQATSEHLFQATDTTADQLDRLGAKVRSASSDSDIEIVTDEASEIAARLERLLEEVPPFERLAAGTRHEGGAAKVDSWHRAVRHQIAEVRLTAGKVRDRGRPDVGPPELGRSIVGAQQLLYNIPVVRPWPND